MKRVIQWLAMVVSFVLAGCTDTEDMTKTALDMGFTNVQSSGYAWLACDGSLAGIYFTAVGENGRPIKGVVCHSLYGNSLRLIP